MIDGAGQIFLQLGLVIILAGIAAFIFRLLKQPQILAYILVGILVTPVFKLITNISIIESMSTIGIAFLLFIVGIEMDIKKLKNVALVSTLGGFIQIIVLFVLGYLIALILGFLPLEAAYIGLIISFSSTMIVMKLLSDNRELSTLHGRIVVGILLLEDIIALFALSVLTSIGGFSWSIFGLALLKFASLFLVAFICSRYLFPKMFGFASKNSELLLVFSLAICFLFSLAFQYLGFSIVIGAFLAGITLGNLDCSWEIVAKVRSLRDFFALLFFVSLGMGLSLGIIKDIWFPLIILLLIIILIKPLITMTICSIFKYTQKPAFLSALSLTQIGEFSLIIAAQGLALGHLTQNTFTLVVILAITTFTLTSYFIKYDSKIYQLLQKPLRIFNIFNIEGMEYIPREMKPKIILCGHNRIGYSILKELKAHKKEILIVDYNPEIINMLVKNGHSCLYGDVTDEEIIEKMNLEHINLLISTIPETKDNLFIIRKVRAVNPKAKIILTASEVDEALKLYQHGADYVVLPHFLGGEHVANLITKVLNKEVKLHDIKADHLHHLKERIALGHEHPKHN